MKKIAAYTVVFIALFSLTGCATWRDSAGNTASDSDTFDCRQKCGLYDRKQDNFTYAFCVSDCMKSKGYSAK